MQGTWLILSSIVPTIVGLLTVGGWSGLTARVDPGLILVWFLSAITMVVVSLLTTPTPQYKITDNVFASAAEQSLGGTGYRFWAGVLFVCTLILWAAFR